MKFTGKLSSEQQIKLCEMLARFNTQSEIKKRVKEWGIEINEQAVDYYRHCNKWKQIIEKMRGEYLSEILEVPIAHKRVRLERLDALYKSAVEKDQLNVAKEVLRAAQDEIEHKSTLSITMNKIELISDDELRERVKRVKQELLQLEAKDGAKDFMRADTVEAQVV